MKKKKMKLEMQKENFGTKKVNKISSNLPVIKSLPDLCQSQFKVDKGICLMPSNSCKQCKSGNVL